MESWRQINKEKPKDHNTETLESRLIDGPEISRDTGKERWTVA